MTAGAFTNPQKVSSMTGDPLVTGPVPSSEKTTPAYRVLTTVPVGKLAKLIASVLALVVATTRAAQT